MRDLFSPLLCVNSQFPRHLLLKILTFFQCIFFGSFVKDPMAELGTAGHTYNLLLLNKVTLERVAAPPIHPTKAQEKVEKVRGGAMGPRKLPGKYLQTFPCHAATPGTLRLQERVPTHMEPQLHGASVQLPCSLLESGIGEHCLQLRSGANSPLHPCSSNFLSSVTYLPLLHLCLKMLLLVLGILCMCLQPV